MSSQSAPNVPLKILIAGGGIAGLTTALGLRQQGHEVTVFERSELAKEFGAAIHIGPNCHSVLKKLGIFPETFGANQMEGIIQYDEKGNLQREMDLRSSMPVWQDSWVLCHRVALHEKLKEKAMEAAGPGLPVTLLTARPVVSVEPSTATVFLADGSKHVGDLVIGADGVSSITRKFVVGSEIKPFPYGKNMFRFMIQRDQIRANPSIAHFVEKDGHMLSWRNDDCALIMYPCQNNTIMNFAGIHPRHMSPAKGEGWDQEATKEKLLEIFGTFGSNIKEMLNLADSTSLRVWSILDMERIPRWYNERLVLMGDSAHPFQPFQGQGACIAVEDAVSLVCLLPFGTTCDDISDRLALYQKIRDERAHKVQEATRMSGRDLSEEERKSYDWTKSIAYNFGHNEWHNSTRALKEYLWQHDTESKIWGPFGFSFGPTPSFAMIPRNSRIRKHFLRFKTSTTFMKSLFPANSFNINTPGTVAQATYEITEELDDGGEIVKKSIGLWLHNVQFPHIDGIEYSGDLLVVLLESSASIKNSATTGFASSLPKLHADIDISRNDVGMTNVRCSQGGNTFLCVTIQKVPSLDALQVVDTKVGIRNEAIQEDSRIFYFQNVPALGKVAGPGSPPALFTSTRTMKSAGTYSISSGEGSKIEVIPRDWEKLPSLHHVASELGEIPIYDFIEASEWELMAGDEFPTSLRIA